MSLGHGAKITTDGLIFAIDGANSKSYPGSGSTVTDLIANRSVTMSGTNISVNSDGNFTFNGSDDKMEIASSLIDVGGDFTLSSSDDNYTLEAWIYVETSQGTTTNADCIIGNDTAVGVGMQVGANGSVPRINYAARSTSNFYSSNLAYNQWYHVCFSHQHGSFTRTFINGSLDSTASSTSFDITGGTYGNMEIGNATGRVSGFFDGLMGPIRVYKKGLSDAEMFLNFSAQKGRFGL